MKSLDQILDSRDGDQQGDTQPDAKPQGAPAATTEPDAATAQGEAKAPATDAGKPGAQAQDPDDQHADPEDRSPEALLRALRSERDERKKERQDHKGRAARFEGELNELRRQNEALNAHMAQIHTARAAGVHPAQAQQPTSRDPVALVESFVSQQVQDLMREERLTDDEERVRGDLGDEAVDRMFETYKGLCQLIPGLHDKVLSSRRPWKAMTDLVRQYEQQQEVGTDLDAFKERIRAEERAKLEAEFSARQQPAQQPVAQRPHLPRSLAAARAAGGASTPTFTGPTPLAAIVNRRG